MEKQKVYSIRKLKNGVASVAIATAFFALGTSQVSAEELQSVNETTVEQELILEEPDEGLVAEETMIEANAEMVEETADADESEVVVDVAEEELVTTETEKQTDEDVLEESSVLDDELEKEDENLISENDELTEDDAISDEIVAEVLDENESQELDMNDVSHQANSFNYEDYYNEWVLGKKNSIIDISTDKSTYKSGEIIKVRANVTDVLFDGNFTILFSNTKRNEYLSTVFSRFEQIADGTYEAFGEIQLDDIVFDQEYVLGNIIDYLGREGPQHLYIIGEEWDSHLPSLGFNIEGLEGVSSTAPEIVEFNVHKEVNNEDSIKQINISTLINSEYELINAYFYLRNIDSESALDYYPIGLDSLKVNSLGQYLGEFTLDTTDFYDYYKGSKNDKYTLYGFRVEDVHGNYTMLHEKELSDFFEKFEFEISSDKPKKQYEVELISIKSDKEYYLPNEQGELTIELKTENEINGLRTSILDIDARENFDIRVFNESDFVKNSSGNYVIKHLFKTPYYLADASYALRSIDVFYSNKDQGRLYDYNVKVGEEFLEPLLHVRYQETPKVETKLETNTHTIVFETQYLDNDSVDVGEDKIITVGVNGERTIVEEITYIEGQVSSRKVVSDTVTKQPVTQIIERGTRVTEVKSETRTEKVAFETIYKDNNNLDIGTEKVVAAGVDGVRTIVESVTYVNGKETNRVVASTNITTNPISRVIERGTKKTEVKTETRNEVLPFKTTYINNPELKAGIENVVTEGVNGVVSITEEVTYENGIEQSRKITSQDVSAGAIDEVIERGTKGSMVVTETKKVVVDFDTKYVENSALYLGLTVIKTPGVKGEITIIEEVTYVNGEETNRVEVSNKVTQTPITQIVERGTRVTEVKTETRTEEIPFEIVYKENPELAEGTKTILTVGVTGTRVIVEEVTYVNGVPTERVMMSSEVTEEAVNQVVEIAVSLEETPTEQPEQPEQIDQGEETEIPVTDYTEASVSQSGIAMLPETGEKDNFALFTAASLSILAGLGLISSAKKKED